MLPQSVKETKESFGVGQTPLPRSQEEIFSRLKSDGRTYFRFDLEVLVDYLDFEYAEEWLYKRMTEEKWGELRKKSFYSVDTHLNGVKADDWDSVRELSYEQVCEKNLIRPSVTKESWDEERAPQTVEFATEQAKSYMAFAWEKANDARGISAGRSVEKLEAWMWLIGRGDLAEFACDENYAPYGKPILAKICEEMGWPNGDDGVSDYPD